MERENNKPRIVKKTNVNSKDLDRLRIDFNKHIENHPSGGDNNGSGGTSSSNVKFKTLGLGEAVEIIK